ncbi:MAG: hypothetical protein HKO59_08275 [Phycisphaerales bacterium]|nr:hypothetical protein [Phycisphaerales bacterium]
MPPVWLDAHLDLAYLALGGRDLTQPAPDDGCISLPALRAANVEIAFATIFTAPNDDGPGGYRADDPDDAERAGLAQLEVYERLETAGELTIVRNKDDLERGPAPRIVLLMEGADPLRNPDSVAAWHERGLRVVGLTWSRGTRYAGGNASGGPLTPAGVELVAALDTSGITHDLSHLSDEACDGVLTQSQGRVVASHSNARTLVPGVRQLRDEHLRVIAERRGVVGVNLFTKFLHPTRRATIADVVAHVEHLSVTMGARDLVGLGSDADGGFGPGDLPEGLDHPARWPALATALTAAGWRPAEVAGFRSGNWRRFLEETL